MACDPKGGSLSWGLSYGQRSQKPESRTLLCCDTPNAVLSPTYHLAHCCSITHFLKMHPHFLTLSRPPRRRKRPEFISSGNKGREVGLHLFLSLSPCPEYFGKTNNNKGNLLSGFAINICDLRKAGDSWELQLPCQYRQWVWLIILWVELIRSLILCMGYPILGFSL